MTPEEFEEQLIRHEGLELKLYECSEGKLSIGVGRNLEDRGITEEEAMILLRNDIMTHAAELAERFPGVRDFDSARYYVLVNMAFNLGVSRLAKFKKMWAALEDRNYELAAAEMLDSKWATQVGTRAIELSNIMRYG